MPIRIQNDLPQKKYWKKKIFRDKWTRAVHLQRSR